jgi:predicted enzyme related to lactoylglutathione lyase
LQFESARSTIHLRNKSESENNMPSPFVWFDNIGAKREETTDFLNKTFGWSANNIGPMTFLTKEGEMPFSATCDAMDGLSGWVPYIEVDDLASAVTNATANGATIVAENLTGPAGVATFIQDPGGAPLALWKRGEAAKL